MKKIVDSSFDPHMVVESNPIPKEDRPEKKSNNTVIIVVIIALVITIGLLIYFNIKNKKVNGAEQPS